MIATPGGGQKKLQRHRLIERPRLIKLLEGSKARALIFVAPAGFGKTTLADQWIVSGGRSGAWFRARPSSTDVAGLALDVARAASTIVPGCDERLREHLRAVPAPGDNVDTLAEIVAEDLHSWPSTAWLVIDEYQEISGAKDAERFVESLFDLSPAQFVIASRQQPGWATQRRVVEGQLIELNPDDLAMRDDEAAEVLASRGAPPSGLLALARGWPAAIGLASVSAAEIADAGQVSDSNGVRESLYRFIAEEIFIAFDESVQNGLVALSIAPVIDRQLTESLLGAEVAAAVLRAAIDVGIMIERDGQLELHPLARSFLDERAGQAPATIGKIAAECGAHYRGRRDWDAVLEVVSRHAIATQLEPALLEGLDDLLDTGRLGTVEAWCSTASQLRVESPVVLLARAELGLRSARFTEAQTLAEAAASAPSELTYRAISVAGRAAHMASREEEAVDLYRAASGVARSEEERREAQWCELACLIDLESPTSRDKLDAMRAGVVRSNARDVVRKAGVGLLYSFRFGGMDLAEADRAYQLLDVVRDASVQASFQCLYGDALTLATRYADALDVANAVTALARDLRLGFALPYALHARAGARGGRREWLDAETDIEEALSSARRSHDSYAQHICLALKIRLLTQRGRHIEAIGVDVPALSSSLPAGLAEAVASRGLALASGSRLREAMRAIDRVRGLSSAIEQAVLVSAVEAIVALKSRDPTVSQKVNEFVELAFEHGALDMIVVAYRSTPELLSLLLRRSDRRDELARLLVRANDEDLASALGHQVAPDDPRARLSPREREVFAHLQAGLSNAQIAATLVIAESTAKRHVHRILEKLGYDDRNAIAFQALLERHTHATSAIDDTGDDTESSVL